MWLKSILVEDENSFFCIINTIVAGDLVTQTAKPSDDMDLSLPMIFELQLEKVHSESI